MNTLPRPEIVAEPCPCGSDLVTLQQVRATVHCSGCGSRRLAITWDMRRLGTLLAELGASFGGSRKSCTRHPELCALLDGHDVSRGT